VSRAALRRATYVVLAVAAFATRWVFIDVQSIDYTTFLSQWWDFIVAHGHLRALADAGFSNYNTPYLFLMALASYVPVPAIVAIKCISFAFDLALAGVASRLAHALAPGRPELGVAVFGVVCFLPTVVMNSAIWGQCDAIYATFCLLSILALVRGKPWLSAAWFGVAFAFKLQALFLLPVLAGVMIVNRLRVRALALAPVTFLACLVPALVAGRSLMSQLAIYPGQIEDPSGMQGVGAQVLTHNAPTPYAWLPRPTPSWWLYVGLGVTALVVLSFGIWLLWRRSMLSPSQVVLVAATALLLVPVLLPDMHDRYYYVAEVLSVVACLADRRYLVPAIGIQVASISTYLAFLTGTPLMPLASAAGVAVLSALAAAATLILALRRPTGATPLS